MDASAIIAMAVAVVSLIATAIVVTHKLTSALAELGTQVAVATTRLDNVTERLSNVERLLLKADKE